MEGLSLHGTVGLPPAHAHVLGLRSPRTDAPVSKACLELTRGPLCIQESLFCHYGIVACAWLAAGSNVQVYPCSSVEQRMRCPAARGVSCQAGHGTARGTHLKRL